MQVRQGCVGDSGGISNFQIGPRRQVCLAVLHEEGGVDALIPPFKPTMNRVEHLRCVQFQTHRVAGHGANR